MQLRLSQGQLTRGEQIVWAAGFFDGEGCVSITGSPNQNQPTKRRYQLIVSATQVGRRPLELLLALFGGHLEPHYRSQGSADKRRSSWRWVCSGPTAAGALAAMRPYLVVKGEQADLGLAFQARRLPRAKRSDRVLAEANRERDAVACVEMQGLKR